MSLAEDTLALKAAVERELKTSDESNADFYIDEFNRLLALLKTEDSKIFEDIKPIGKPEKEEDIPLDVGNLLRRILYFCELIMSRIPPPRTVRSRSYR